jgi:hypothetical protein
MLGNYANNLNKYNKTSLLIFLKKYFVIAQYFPRSNMVVNDYFIPCVVLCLSFNLECVVF